TSRFSFLLVESEVVRREKLFRARVPSRREVLFAQPSYPLLRPGQFGKRRMRLGLIPIGHAVIVVATAERRTAISVFNLEAHGLPESNRVGHVPPVCSGIRLF